MDVASCRGRLSFSETHSHFGEFRRTEGMNTILLIILILLLLGALPTWPHSRNWGYAPSGGIGLVLTILIILILFGVI